VLPDFPQLFQEASTAAQLPEETGREKSQKTETVLTCFFLSA
jgi:hypothetical protein